MSLETLVSLLVGSAISIVATWAFAHIYYRRAGKDLTGEAERLREESGKTRQMLNVLAHALEVANLIDVTWDDNGELKSFVIRGAIAINLPSLRIAAEGTSWPAADHPGSTG